MSTFQDPQEESGGVVTINAIDTTQTGFTGLVDQWKFEGNLNAEGGTGRNLVSTHPEERFGKIRGKGFFSCGKNGHLNRGGVHDAVYDLPGAVTIYLTADIHQMPTSDSVLFLFGTPGFNSAGTNYQWALIFESGGQNVQSIHEHGGGIKEIVDSTAPPSGIAVFTIRRTADLGGGAQDVTLFVNGEPVITEQTPRIADDGAGTQEINIGQIITMLVFDAVVCSDAHTDETILQVSQQVGVTAA